MNAKNPCKTYLLRGVPMELWQRLRHRAVDEGISLREILLRAIEQYLITGK